MLLLTIFSFHFVVVLYILGYLFNYIEFIFQYCVTVSFCIMDFSQGKAIIILHNTSIFLSFTVLYNTTVFFISVRAGWEMIQYQSKKLHNFPLLLCGRTSPPFTTWFSLPGTRMSLCYQINPLADYPLPIFNYSCQCCLQYQKWWEIEHFSLGEYYLDTILLAEFYISKINILSFFPHSLSFKEKLECCK